MRSPFLETVIILGDPYRRLNTVSCDSIAKFVLLTLFLFHKDR
jgi:hypothetical protein